MSNVPSDKSPRQELPDYVTREWLEKQREILRGTWYDEDEQKSLVATDCIIELAIMGLDARRPPTGPQIAHTDHPLRHWDRTCPACIAEAAQGETPSATRRSILREAADVVADAVLEVADAAKKALCKAGIDPESGMATTS